MAKKQEQLLSDIAEILAVQNDVDNVARDQLDNNMYTIDHLNEDFHSILNEQEKMINLLKNKTSNRDDDLLQSIDNILNISKKNYAFKNEIIEYTEYDEDFERYIENNRKFAQEHNIDISNPFKNMYSEVEYTRKTREIIEKFDVLQLSKYDYAFASAVGVIMGLVDVTLVGTVGGQKSNSESSYLQTKVDKVYDKLVMDSAKKKKIADIELNRTKALNAHPEKALEINNKFDGLVDKANNMDKTQCIRYMANKYKVSYDSTKNLEIPGVGRIINNSPDTHHNKSLAHDPGLLGLITGIMDQLDNKITFIAEVQDNKGNIVTKLVRAPSDQPHEIGGNKIERIIKSIENWYGHCLSDVAGSESTKIGNRGSGLPAPFWSTLQKLDFGNVSINGQNMTLGEVSNWMFKQGYDLRAFTTELIPVLINEFMIRSYWFLKQRFYYGKTGSDVISCMGSREIRRLLLVSTSVFSTIDVGHALIKSAPQFGGKGIGEFLLTVNLPGLADFGLRCVQNVRDNIKHKNHLKELDKDLNDQLLQIMMVN